MLHLDFLAKIIWEFVWKYGIPKSGESSLFPQFLSLEIAIFHRYHGYLNGRKATHPQWGFSQRFWGPLDWPVARWLGYSRTFGSMSHNWAGWRVDPCDFYAMVSLSVVVQKSVSHTAFWGWAKPLSPRIFWSHWVWFMSSLYIGDGSGLVVRPSAREVKLHNCLPLVATTEVPKPGSKAFELFWLIPT